MIESILTSTGNEPFTIINTFAVLGTALALGLAVSLVYMFIRRADGFSRGFSMTLIMMPAIIAAIVFLIGNNVARAFSLAGAFSLIRFRSAAGEPRDIAFVLFSLGVGLACGIGYLGYAALFAAIMCAAMILMHFAGMVGPKSSIMQLKIAVPENINYQGLFDDILKRYARSWRLRKIKSTDFGTLFELAFTVNLRADADSKRMIDELRARNGNLSITLTAQQTEDTVYA